MACLYLTDIWELRPQCTSSPGGSGPSRPREDRILHRNHSEKDHPGFQSGLFGYRSEHESSLVSEGHCTVCTENLLKRLRPPALPAVLPSKPETGRVGPSRTQASDLEPESCVEATTRHSMLIRAFNGLHLKKRHLSTKPKRSPPETHIFDSGDLLKERFFFFKDFY